jgi:tetratricopeptide (TPR) repeat protein
MFLGKSLSLLGQYEEAITYYDRVLAIDQNFTLVSRNKQLAIDNLG